MLFASHPKPRGPFPSLTFGSWDEWESSRSILNAAHASQQEQELAIAAGRPRRIRFKGECAACEAETTFKCDWRLSSQNTSVRRLPVWRERLRCPRCNLNARVRAAVHLSYVNAGLRPESAVYLSEQTTPLYRFMRKHVPGVVGSEYLLDGTPLGAVNKSGIRNEDITALSFADSSFDVVISGEVLEHVPDYKAGLAEMCRTLKRGGSLIASFPFDLNRPTTLIRALVESDGSITHLTEPEFHGDPIRKGGVLCFYHFGWSVLDDLRAVGFSQAILHLYWSLKAGYLGGGSLLIHAVK
jgi:hypothetical protein